MDLRLADETRPPASPVDRVLIVDDDELILKALSRVLESAGYQARCYQAPEAALEAIEREAPVVVISDYMMPGMDGVTFLNQARVRFPAAVRILCTAAEDFRVALQAVNSGEVFRIISKPWHQQELLATVNQAAEAARLRRENERLTNEVQRQNGQLREMNQRLEEMVRVRTQALLEGLIAALDYRDAETQWHSRRVSLYARRLAAQLGIREPELTVIEHGALLHDIGKIGVRDRVLLKPGPLTSEEWTEMKRHPDLGWALLQRVDYLRPASSIVLQHQEKWDGSGYPRGLKGQEIVVGARVFHVVDTLDAITSDRPYRRARPFEEARQEITRCGGTQFDPAIVAAFLGVPAEEWERIRLDVETVAVLSADLAENPPAQDELRGAIDAALRVVARLRHRLPQRRERPRSPGLLLPQLVREPPRHQRGERAGAAGGEGPIPGPERVAQLARPAEPLLRLAGERAQDDPVELGRDPRVRGGRRRDLRGADLLHHRQRRRRGEEPLAGEQLVQHDPEREHVGAPVDRRPADHLRAHVAELAAQDRARRRRAPVRRLRDAEVDDPDRPVEPDEHVRRRDVAVDDPQLPAVRAPPPVRVVERVGRLRHEVGDHLERHRLGPRAEPGRDRAQVATGHVVHREVVPAGQLPELVDRHDPRVIELHGDPRLVEEQPDELAVLRQRGEDPLDGVEPSGRVAAVDRREHLGHAADRDTLDEQESAEPDGRHAWPLPPIPL